MITSLSLSHPMLRSRISLAMIHAQTESREKGVGLAHVGGIDVVHIRGEYKFFDRRDHEITDVVIAALREYNLVEAA